MGHEGVGWVIQGWVGCIMKGCSGLDHAGVGWGGSCRGRVGFVMKGWGGSCRGRVGVGHAEMGWAGLCRGGVGCIMQGCDGLDHVGWEK